MTESDPMDDLEPLSPPVPDFDFADRLGPVFADVPWTELADAVRSARDVEARLTPLLVDAARRAGASNLAVSKRSGIPYSTFRLRFGSARGS